MFNINPLLTLQLSGGWDVKVWGFPAVSANPIAMHPDIRKKRESLEITSELVDQNFQKCTHIVVLEGEKYLSNPTTDKQCEVPH